MTRPYQRWDALWNIFMALDEEWPDFYEDEEAAMAAELQSTTTPALEQATREWHEAFDSADAVEVERIVGDFSPSYDPSEKFGGYRQWADWVREHLEAELARRKAGSTAG